jgi:hypothetical protein
MSHALGPHMGSDIFPGKFSKITKKIKKTSTEASLAPDSCKSDYTHSCTYVHGVYCVVQLGPTPFCQPKMMHILVACYRDRVAILFIEALQLLVDLCLLFWWLHKMGGWLASE